jgi:hypothetical protein
MGVVRTTTMRRVISAGGYSKCSMFQVFHGVFSRSTSLFLVNKISIKYFYGKYWNIGTHLHGIISNI